MNLLSNAIKYGSGSTVHVSVRQCSLADAVSEAQNAGASDLKLLDDDFVDWSAYSDQIVTVVSVRDHGEGIPCGEWGSLFGEFVQLNVSQEMDRKYASNGTKIVAQTSGSGLGLNLVLKFVTRMNGHIWATNSQTGGAIFSFCFPVGDDGRVNLLEDCSHHSSRRDLALSEEDIDWLQVVLVDDSSKCTNHLLGLNILFLPLLFVASDQFEGSQKNAQSSWCEICPDLQQWQSCLGLFETDKRPEIPTKLDFV